MQRRRVLADFQPAKQPLEVSGPRQAVIVFQLNPATCTIETTRRLLTNEGFKGRHRVSDQTFMRVRCLPFAVVLLVLILIKSIFYPLVGVYGGSHTASQRRFVQLLSRRF